MNEQVSVQRLAKPSTHGAIWWHVVCVAWLVAAALIALAPVLAHGASFGSYDVLSQFGVLRQPGVVVHNLQGGDQADQIIPWSRLAWTQVHQGHLPLWNPYEGLGMPLAFGWQAAAASVPSLIGYLFPLNLSVTVQVVVTLVIAGTGVYVLGRALGLGTLGCIFAATTFELSGPMLGWLGWPHAAVLSWSGWLFAAALLVIRGRHRLWSITLFALVIAAMVYAGQAEVLVLCGLALAVFLVALLVQRAPALGGSGPLLRPSVDLCVGGLIGAALGAPLLLPGLQVARGSQRALPGGDPAELLKGNPPLPAHNLVHVLFQGFDGLPVAGSRWFGYVGGYSETAAYVGVVAVALAVTALAVRRRRPDVVAFGVMCGAMVVVAFLPAAVAALYRLPLVGTVLWQRAILPLAFGLAVLAGVGLDSVVREWSDRTVRRRLGWSFAGVAVVVAGLWLFYRGSLPPAESAIRSDAFIWPLVGIVVGTGVVCALAWAERRSVVHGRGSAPALPGRLAGVALLVSETAFLVAAGAPLWTSSPTPYASTPAVLALQRTVGSSVVGLGEPLCFLPPGLGIPENAQAEYGVQELALYDPMIPSEYYSSWRKVSSTAPGVVDDSVYCPGIATLGLARLYGVSYVLERPGSPGPRGGVFVRRVGSEDLYRMPGAAAATVTPLAPGGGLPADGSSGTPVAVRHPSPSSWKMTVDGAVPQTLRLRLTNVPGWHATIDGRPVRLQSFARVMLQVEVPAGHHTIELSYWPATFSVGLVLFAVAALGLSGAWALSALRHRTRSQNGARGIPDPGDHVSDPGAPVMTGASR
jgi:hypothetical protein